MANRVQTQAKSNREAERRIVVSVVIKTLNEEARIAASIETALAGLDGMEGEVIVADSGSSDRTIEIASRYPVKIVQLAEPRLRRCGAGPQLGFQFARGEFIYILDGDMELDRDFLPKAIQALSADSSLAGVAGLVEEMHTGNAQFRRRKRRGLEGRPGAARWLDMGGLYRCSALASVGYLSNRNLHACEEQDLGLRLCVMGWKLSRLPIPGVRHYGHSEGTLALQFKRLRSGYLLGPGEVLRASLRSNRFWAAAAAHRHLLATLLVWALLAIGLALAPMSGAGLLCWLAAVGALFVGRAMRYRNLSDAAAITLIWHVNALAMLWGFLQRQVDPLVPIEAFVVADHTGGVRNSPPREAQHAA